MENRGTDHKELNKRIHVSKNIYEERGRNIQRPSRNEPEA